MALTDKLTAIGDAIRAKTGAINKFTLTQMPEAIASIETGGCDFGDLEVLSGTFTPTDENFNFVFSENIGYATCNAIMGYYFCHGVGSYTGATREPDDTFYGFSGCVSTANTHGAGLELSSDKKSLVKTSLGDWFELGVEYNYILVRPKYLYVPNSSAIISTFRIGEAYTYQFDDGMFWGDWADSKYSPTSYGYFLYDDGTYVGWYNFDNQFVLAHSDGTPVLQNERIMPGEVCTHVINPNLA